MSFVCGLWILRLNLKLRERGACTALACSCITHVTGWCVHEVPVTGTQTARRVPLRGASGSESATRAGVRCGQAGHRGRRLLFLGQTDSGTVSLTRPVSPPTAAAPWHRQPQRCSRGWPERSQQRRPPQLGWKEVSEGDGSPSPAREKSAAAALENLAVAEPVEPLCVQPNEGRQCNHLTETRALDAPSARMRRRGQ
ncbi:uncharacterized protein LOC128930681 [Callithrix jacchus]